MKELSVKENRATKMVTKMNTYLTSGWESFFHKGNWRDDRKEREAELQNTYKLAIQKNHHVQRQTKNLELSETHRKRARSLSHHNI